MAGFNTLTPWDSQRYFDIPQQNFISVGVIPTSLCLANPMRVGLVISGATGSTVFIGPSPNITSVKGIPLSGNFITIALNHEQWGALVQQQWFGIVGAGSAFVSVIEITLNKWPENESIIPDIITS